jgi:hypothetical protein
VFEVVLEIVHEGFEFFFENGFDDETIIESEEEETSWLSSGLTGFACLFEVERWVERGFNHFMSDSVFKSQLIEALVGIIVNFDVFINVQFHFWMFRFTSHAWNISDNIAVSWVPFISSIKCNFIKNEHSNIYILKIDINIRFLLTLLQVLFSIRSIWKVLNPNQNNIDQFQVQRLSQEITQRLTRYLLQLLVIFDDSKTFIYSYFQGNLIIGVHYSDHGQHKTIYELYTGAKNADQVLFLKSATLESLCLEVPELFVIGQQLEAPEYD